MSALSPELREKYVEDLLATRRRIDRLDTEKAEIRDVFKAALDAEWTHENTVRDILEGRQPAQPDLPGIEAEKTDRERKVGRALRDAIEAVEQITGIEPAPPDEPKEEPPAPGGGEPTVTIGVGDKEVALGPQARKAIDEKLAAEERGGKLIPITKLAWKRGEGDVLRVATLPDGSRYEVVARPGRFDVLRFAPGAAKGPLVGSKLEIADAEKAAREHFLAEIASGYLRNDGHAELTGRDVTGDAVTHKGPRRG